MSRQTVLLIFAATLAGRLTEVTIIYTCVLLHELAHLYMCLRQKIPTAHMAIYPYGMELQLAKLTTPKEQILISAAGPAVNLVLLTLGYIIEHIGVRGYYISFFTGANLILFVFNMLPCTPLDGSEILRSAISSKKGIIYSYTAVNRISQTVSFFILLCACMLALHRENISLLIVLAVLRQGMYTKKHEQLLAAKQVISGEIHSRKKPKVVYSQFNQNASAFVKYISFDYTLIILRPSKPPLTQQKLLDALKKNPGISIENI